MQIDMSIRAADLLDPIEQVFRLAAAKAKALDESWDPAQGTPVFTVEGQYATRGWTEWTQGFQYGCQLLAGEGAGDTALLQRGKQRIIERMLPHVTHIGVHDHGFNNLSTYGNLLRLMDEQTLPCNEWERQYYRQAVAVSGAVQAARWAETSCGLGYIYSFNGPHSLFIDTMRTLRILSVAHQLGHVLMGENDRRIDLLQRTVQHALATSKYIVFHGDSEHTYDVRGRTAHEGTFNRNDGCFRARATQQGYSPFSTWTRGLAWAMLGFAEQLEWLSTIPPDNFTAAPEKLDVIAEYSRAARDTCDHYIEDTTSADGITYWDDGAPGLAHLGDWRQTSAAPANNYEPVDASASAIAAQGLLRLGQFYDQDGDRSLANRYRQAGLTVARTLFAPPYLSTEPDHQGLLLHSVYHWPNGWDHLPEGSSIPHGESSMWGDYHLLELALLVRRLGEEAPYPTFFCWAE